MKKEKTAPSQLKANREYRKRISQDEEKRLHRNYMTLKRAARSFIHTQSTLEDLNELEQLITQRRKELK